MDQGHRFQGPDVGLRKRIIGGGSGSVYPNHPLRPRSRTVRRGMKTLLAGLLLLMIGVVSRLGVSRLGVGRERELEARNPEQRLRPIAHRTIALGSGVALKAADSTA